MHRLFTCTIIRITGMLFGVSLFFHTQFLMKQATTIEEQVELLKKDEDVHIFSKKEHPLMIL